MKFKTIQWKKKQVRILDQRWLPHEVVCLDCQDGASVAEAIKNMTIRGAPAIGVAAAMGIALAAKTIQIHDPQEFCMAMEAVCHEMSRTRPTAVNLSWAIERMRRILAEPFDDVKQMKVRLEREALKIYKEDIEVNRKIGAYGKDLIREGMGILTHCNAGALATAGHGTALGVLYSAWQEGKRFRVYVTETRPLLQGARLTAWELTQMRIPTILLTDNMAGSLMKKGLIQMVLVGADRIAGNGDTANKIGTYGLAILANYHRIPLYIAAPTSSIDLCLATGEDIPIEERSSQEVTHIRGISIAPKGVRVTNPSFDVTPHPLIEGIITQKGIVRKPYYINLKKL